MKRTILKKLLTAFVVLAILATPNLQAFAQDPAKDPAKTDVPPAAITEKDLLDQLEQISAWQRNILSIDVAPDNSLENLLKDTLAQSASKVLQYGFDFARAEATTLIAEKQDPALSEDPTSSHAKILKAVNDNAQHVKDIQTEQTALEVKIKRTRAALRTPLLIQRERLASELKIANARQDLLQSVTSLFSDKEAKSSDTVLDKVNNLSMTLPATPAKTSKAAATASAPAITLPLPIALPQPSATPDSSTDQPKSHGLITVTSDIFTLYRKKKNLDTLLQETDALTTNTQRLITTLRTILQDAVKNGNDMAATLNTADKATVELQREKIDVFVDNFKQQSTAVVPLAQVNKWVDAGKGDLKEWRNSLDEQMTHLLRSLLLQLSLLAMAVIIPLAISEAMRRTITKYIQDSKRQHQLNIARRGVVGVVVIIIVLLNFVTELDSLATFAGFLTAGIAVALQNVILSLVAHFFYFGRFGIRVGDRVKIKDITGEVVQVGMVRLYLMELGGPDYELHPTGRIVAYPNSILFQNDPFIKMISGADYIWQEITFILDPQSDYQLAHKKMNEAVKVIHAQYHDVMETQKMALTRSTHLNVTMPAPRGFLDFTDAGLAMNIRYPIQTDRVEEINQCITDELLKLIDANPALKLVRFNPPKTVVTESDKS